MLKRRWGSRACVHVVCVLGSESLCKNGEPSVSPKPQDPSRKSKVLNIWSQGFTRQRNPGTHLTEDGGRPTHY